MVAAILGKYYTLKQFRDPKLEFPSEANRLTFQVPGEDLDCDVGDYEKTKYMPVKIRTKRLIKSDDDDEEERYEDPKWDADASGKLYLFCAEDLKQYLTTSKGSYGLNADTADLFFEGNYHDTNPFNKDKIVGVQYLTQAEIEAEQSKYSNEQTESEESKIARKKREKEDNKKAYADSMKLLEKKTMLEIYKGRLQKAEKLLAEQEALLNRNEIVDDQSKIKVLFFLQDKQILWTNKVSGLSFFESKGDFYLHTIRISFALESGLDPGVFETIASLPQSRLTSHPRLQSQNMPDIQGQSGGSIKTPEGVNLFSFKRKDDREFILRLRFLVRKPPSGQTEFSNKEWEKRMDMMRNWAANFLAKFFEIARIETKFPWYSVDKTTTVDWWLRAFATNQFIKPNYFAVIRKREMTDKDRSKIKEEIVGARNRIKSLQQRIESEEERQKLKRKKSSSDGGSNTRQRTQLYFALKF